MSKVEGKSLARDPLRTADALLAQGREEEAEAAYREILASLETAQGEEHPCLIPVLETLAGLMWFQGRNEEAKEFADRAFHLMSLGTKH